MTEEDELDRLYPKQGMEPTPEWRAERAAYRAAHPLPPEDEEDGDNPAGAPVFLTPDEARKRSAEKLVGALDSLTNLTRHCEHMASIPSNDRIAPVFAAARLIEASALAVKAVSLATSVEHRQRRIIERIQSVAPKNAELNSKLDAPTPEDSNQDLSKQAATALDGLLFETLQRKMLLLMNMLAAEAFDTDLKKAYPEAYAPGGTFGEPLAQASVGPGVQPQA